MIKIRPETGQTLAMTQEQIQSLQVLSMTYDELFSFAKEIAEKNCVVDMDALYDNRKSCERPVIRELQHSWRVRRNADDAISPLEMLGSNDESLQSFLRQQINENAYSLNERNILLLMISRVDDDGRISMEDPIVQELYARFPQTTENMIACIQMMEPAGVGARNMEECIRLQLSRAEPRNHIAEMIAERFMSLAAKGEFSKIAKQLCVPKKEVIAAYHCIQSLDPFPGREFGTSNTEMVLPDIIITNDEDGFQIELNTYGIPCIKIDSTYERMHFEESGEMRTYLAAQYQQARFLQRSIEQRNRTLSELAECILRHQYLFFLKGERYLRPMRQKEIAKELDVHESTISRAIRNKSLQCKWGTFPLKHFFSARQQSEETMVNPLTVIQDLIERENPYNPISDEEIALHLQAMGMSIARRTISKYRDELNIPSAKKRKKKNNL